MAIVSERIAQFLRTRHLSPTDIKMVQELVAELEAVIVEKTHTILAARQALQQQSRAIRSLTDNFLEQQERRRELQGQTAGDRRREVARASEGQSEGALKNELPISPK